MFAVEPWSRELYDQLYSEVFCRDFKSTPILYRGSRVWYFPEMFLGRELIFVHLTSREDKQTGERAFDSMRSARLPWARPLIEHPEANEVLAWDFEEGDKNFNTYVWLQNQDYLVLMRKMKDGSRRILTAYWTEYSHEKKKLQRKYEQRVQ
jgi:hypothetical protein